MSVSKSIGVRGGVLVAHDGSVHSAAALRTAARLAEALGAPMTVVRAWGLSTAPTPPGSSPGYLPPLEQFEAATLAALERDVASVRADHPSLAMTTAVVHRRPAEALIDASDDVDLIVVGRRGRGGFAGLTLGSVSERVVRHARCPVLVDKGPGPSEETDAPDEHDLMDALASELKLD
jgi:nucleotide-binding universal stress UspA family protein